MSQDELISFFERRGYVCVSTPRSYRAIPATDVINGEVRRDARSVIEVSAFVLEELTTLDVEQFLDQVLATGVPSMPFDINKTHTVLSGKKPDLPEWRGWTVEHLRSVFGLDDKR